MRTHHWIDGTLVATAIAGGVAAGPVVPVACVAVAVSIHAWGVVHPRSSLYLPVYARMPGRPPAIALTYDDGPDPDNTPRILDLLAARGATATFFVVGEQARRHPGLVRRMASEGHALGLHSDRHSRWFNCWSGRRVEEDLRANGDAIAQAAGIPPPVLFRPPVGLKNPIVGRVAERLGLVCIAWSCGGNDAADRPLATLEWRFSAGLKPGAIVLIHDGMDPARPLARPHALALTARLLDETAGRGLYARALHPGMFRAFDI